MLGGLWLNEEHLVVRPATNAPEAMAPRRRRGTRRCVQLKKNASKYALPFVWYGSNPVSCKHIGFIPCPSTPYSPILKEIHNPNLKTQATVPGSKRETCVTAQNTLDLLTVLLTPSFRCV